MSTDIALPSENRQPTLRDQIQRMEHQFSLAAPRGVEAKQIVRDALTALSQNPDLANCTPQSVLGGLMTMAQLGLRVGVLGHGWLIPFNNTRKDDYGNWQKVREAQLVIGYQGLVALAYRSGQIEKITARTVHENDYFDVEYGLNEHLSHRPATGDRGKPTGYYATVKIRDAEPMFYYMTHEEMEVYRDRYAMSKKGPWATEFEGMAKKTCLRQLSKYMPKGTDLAVALSVDDTVRVDLSPQSQPEYVSAHVERPTATETPHVAGSVAAESAELPMGGDD